MLRTVDVLAMLNIIAPFDIAESWDNCGLQVGNADRKVKKVIIGLDVSLPLMADAKDWGADLVITHHPLMIKPEKKIDFTQLPGKIIELAAKHEINIVSVHTNLDKAHDGLNDYFASRIGINDPLPFPSEKTPGSNPLPLEAAGRIGQLKNRMSLAEFANHIKAQLNLNHLRVTGNMDLIISTAVICTGSGASLLDDFLKSQAQVFVSGDMKYHDARRIEDHSRAMIDVGHFESEHIAIDLLFEKLSAAFHAVGSDIQIRKFEKEKNPFTIV